MLRTRGLLVLALVTAAVVAAAAWTMKSEDPLPERGTLVFPDLLARINDVTRVEVVTPDARFELARGGDGRWRAPERHGYALDGDKMQELLVGMAALERVEPKTGNPELYASLGVGAPGEHAAGDDDPSPLGYRFETADGAVLADLIVGARRAARGDPSDNEYYVREPEEARSWLVEGTLPGRVTKLTDWLDTRLLRIDPARIRSVTLTHPDGEIVTARRPAPADNDFEYVQRPEGAELEDPWRVNDTGKLMGDLSFDDVRPRGEAPLERGGDGVVEAVTETFDGLRVQMLVGGSGSEPLAVLSAELLPEPAAGAVEADALKPREEVESEVAELNARWDGWTYVLPEYKADYARRRQSDSIKSTAAEEAPAPAQSPAHGAGDRPAPPTAPSSGG